MTTPRTRRFALAAAITFAIASLAPRAGAQQDANVQRGFAAEKVYAFGDIDSVNLFNGNLVLTLPIGGSYPVDGGLSYGLKLIYNSNIWDFQTRLEPVWDNGVVIRYDSFTQARVGTSFNAGAGWTLSLGRMYAPNHPDNPPRGAPTPSSPRTGAATSSTRSSTRAIRPIFRRSSTAGTGAICG